MDKKELLENSSYFCMMPWTHMHFWATGEVYACCMAHPQKALGHLKNNRIPEIWNSDNMKALRKNMLENKASKECTRCYELEKSTNILTLRKNANISFAHHFPLVETTKDNGQVDQVNMAYMDIRFSNLCNFRCRTCGPAFSHSWVDDFEKLYGPLQQKKILSLMDNPSFWLDLQPLLDQVEEVYFAGGEALISEEHYKILDRWLQQGRKNIRLRYTTNFSNMNFKEKSIYDYWNAFSDVRVAASLDGQGERAEYIRKGTLWTKIEKNRLEMKEKCPHVYFEITPTVSLFNVHHLPDFHRSWVEKGLIEVNAIRVNPLMMPSHQKAQVLPLKIKDQIKEKYLAHMEWLKSFSDSEYAQQAFANILSFLYEEDHSDELRMFFKSVDQLDSLRKEDFTKTFPEYASLRSFI